MRLSNFGRTCEVKVRTWVKDAEGKKNPVDIIQKAVFHQWGNNFIQRKESPPSYQTIGIVELRDGKTTRILPEFIKFTEPMREIQ